MDDIVALSDKIEHELKKYNGKRLFTVAISGIDAAGKGYVTELLRGNLKARSYHVAAVNIDPWQNPQTIRLQNQNPAENFYNNVFRWNAFFAELINPLQQEKSIELEKELIHTDADQYYTHTYHYNDLDLLIIEGIFLFQEKYLPAYDYKIWIDCSFETGLRRAMRRNTENLSNEKLISDYHTYYYAAQRFHFKKDNPRELADTIFNND